MNIYVCARAYENGDLYYSDASFDLEFLLSCMIDNAEGTGDEYTAYEVFIDVPDDTPEDDILALIQEGETDIIIEREIAKTKFTKRSANPIFNEAALLYL